MSDSAPTEVASSFSDERTLAQAAVASSEQSVYRLSPWDSNNNWWRHAPTRSATTTIDALRSFCEGSPEVVAGYVCAALQSDDAAETIRRLKFCVKLTVPVYERGDGDDVARDLFQRFVETAPDLARSFGFGVLADRGVAAYATNGISIFSRDHRLG